MSNNTCSFRWTGENCTIDNYQDIPFVAVMGIYQAVFMFLFAAFFCVTIKRLIEKRSEGASPFSYAFFSMYLTLIGCVLRVIHFIDPWNYFQINTLLWNFIFWLGTYTMFGAAVFAYVIWLEAIMATKNLLQAAPKFKIAKIIFIGYVSTRFIFFAVVLVISLIAGAAYFTLLLIFISIGFTILYIGAHLFFLPEFNKVVKNSVSKKIKHIYVYLNWMVLGVNITNLVVGFSSLAISFVLPFSDPARAYYEFVSHFIYRAGDMLLLYMMYNILLYRDKESTSFSTTGTKYSKSRGSKQK
eukprot:TRINITY_DN1280_c0_g1_i1.p1 TRINITY_DN1280_c0_g1~~TRINITY_DN1280_c0_g1_i1.p1  ORF type:complete len:314 (-),score=58.36 TRINITY_DN1280_c0_g1_i1:62-958(-)